MKNLKKILAWLLLACMVLTFASCKKDEEKKNGKKTAETKAAEKNQRVFTGTPVEGENYFYIGKSTEDGFELYCIDPLGEGGGKYTRNADGTVVFEGVEAWGGVTMAHVAGDLYRMVACENPDDEFMEAMEESSILRLNADGTFAAHDCGDAVRYSYAAEDGKTILRAVYGLYMQELWQEGNTLSMYSGERGTYTSLNRGAIQLVTMTIDGDQINGTIEDDKLTVNNDGDTFVMTRMNATKFFCLEDDEEMIVELLPDGTMTVMGLSERMNGSITFEAGKQLVWTITYDGETSQIGFVIEDKELRLLGYDGDEEIILIEDVAVMKNFDAAVKTMYPELGEWMLVGAEDDGEIYWEGEFVAACVAEMQAEGRTIVFTFDGNVLTRMVTMDNQVDESADYWYYTYGNTLDFMDNNSVHNAQFEISGDTMKLAIDGGPTLLYQRK